MALDYTQNIKRSNIHEYKQSLFLFAADIMKAQNVGFLLFIFL